MYGVLERAQRAHDTNATHTMTAAFLTPIPLFAALAASHRRTTSPVRRGVVFAAADGGRRNLELNWKYQEPENRRPVTCPDCKGSGKTGCQWCNATGALMIGGVMVCSIDGHTRCYVCDDGEVDCKKCCGHGTIAGWLT